MNTGFDIFAGQRWYGREAIQSIYNYFGSGNQGNPLIAMPTGSGKTHVIGGFIKSALHYYPNQRFIVATHVQELIEQNANKFAEMWPHAPYGVYSAGLKSRDYMQPIIFGGVQSMVKCVEAFGHRDILIVDEAHLVAPGDGTNYQRLIGQPDRFDENGKFIPGYGLRKINPYLKVVGLSATIYRMGIGYITSEHEGRIFTDVCYDLTTMEGFARLIAEGYLSPLIPKRTDTEIDVSNVGRSSTGDYNQAQLQKEANREAVTRAALTEALHYGYNRQSWLAFASGIEHTENISAMLNQMGIPASYVHNKTTADDRRKRIEAHKRGELRCLVGNNIFTTGYDHPPLDYIIDLQPTLSVPKHVQKAGRGMRVFPPYKENCLYMDFGGNTRRNGPINDPYVPKRKGEGGGDAPVKICEHCGTYNHPSFRFCIGCDEEFEFKTKIIREADETPIMKNDLPVVETFPVNQVLIYKHVSKSSGLPTLAVSYISGLSQYIEYVPVQNPKGKHIYHEWWRARSASEDIPDTVDEVIRRQHELRIPQRVRVWVNRKHPQILGVEW